MVNQIKDAIALIEQHLELLKSWTDIGVCGEQEEVERWESALYILRSLNALVDVGFIRAEMAYAEGEGSDERRTTL